MLRLNSNFILFTKKQYKYHLDSCQIVYTNYMDIEKENQLQRTADVEYIITDSFILNGCLTDLYLYPTELKLMQRNMVHCIPYNLDLTFAIINSKDGPIGISLRNQNEKLDLLRDFWPRAGEWENILLNYITRRDFHEFFKPLKKIGQGTFANVYLAQDLRKHLCVAIKAFMKQSAFKNNGKMALWNEIKMMRKVKSQSIAQLRGVFQSKNSLYLSMEYLQGDTLEAFLKRHKQIEVEYRKSILRSLLIGLRDMKQQGIVHRDIKPENVIISSDLATVKIVDFGLATEIEESNYIYVKCGTPGYVAPEILQIKDVQNVRLGVESDMFSLGALYYQILYDRPLFPGADYVEVLRSNKMCRIKLYEKYDAGYGQIELLSGMLEIDPNYRVTPQQALDSAFLREMNPCRNVLQSLENINLSTSSTSMDE